MIVSNTIKVREWNELVKSTYGKIYNFQQQDGCKDRQTVHIRVPCYPDDFENDTVPEVVNGDIMGVSFNAWLNRDVNQKLNTDDKWDKEHGIELWWERNFYPHVSMIINDLYSKGILPEGSYRIKIDW